jgi:hypothetical protein
MDDIKYFFLNKINQTIQGGQKNFSEGTNYRLSKNIIFQNLRGTATRGTLDPPLSRNKSKS